MIVKKRRRRESKTDYLTRRKLLKSDKPRLVFRKSNKYVLAQYVISEEAKDTTKITLTSKNLLKYGWPKENQGGLKSLPASYLTGYLIGKRILKEKLEEPIADLGMLKTIHKTKVFAFLKGAIDAGLKLKCAKEAFPDEVRIKGEHLKNKIKFEEIKSKIE